MNNNKMKNSIYGGSSGGHSPKNRKPKKWLIVTSVVLLVLVLLYLLAAYSRIPFIRDLRTAYIETAMSTFHHKWLATYFLPKSVVDEVVRNMEKELEENMVPESQLPPAVTPPATGEDVPPAPVKPPVTTPGETEIKDMGVDALIDMFYEIDRETIPADLDCHDLQVKDIADLAIRTTAGDVIWAIDMPNGILIVNVEGDGYKGKLAIVRDSSRVILALNDREGYGRNLNYLCKHNNAVLGINASGFEDVGGVGHGDIAVGLVLSDGVVYNEALGSPYQICGYDYENNFRMGYELDIETLRCAVQFTPIVVLNGRKYVNGTSLHPRTVIGQTTDKSTLMLIIDGRQPLYSLGTTLGECADILLRYDCYNAMAMDGGSSSSMTYMGEMITRTSSPQKGGRYLPDAWVVLGTTPESEK